MVNGTKILLTLFFATFLLIPFEQGSDVVYADVDCIPIGGQAWNQYLGWVVNQGAVEKNTPGPEENYGICKEDPTGIDKKEVKGAVWSVYGWICWGKSCDINGYGSKTPPSGSLETYIDETPDPDGDSQPGYTLSRDLPHQPGKKLEVHYYPVYGWAKITNLKNNGWVSLSGDIDANTVQDLEDFNNKNFDCANAAANIKQKKCRYFVYYDIDKNEFGGWAWNNKVGWIGFSGRTLYTTPYQYDTAAGTTVKGNACDPYCKEASFDEDIDSNKFLTQYLGRWVDVRGGNAYAQKGFGGKSASPPKAISYVKATGKYKETNAGGTEEKKEGDLGKWRSGCDDSQACNEFGIRKKINGLSGSTLKGVYDVGTPKISNGSVVKELKSKLGSLNVDELVLPAGDNGRTNKYGQEIVRIIDPLTLDEGTNDKHLKNILSAPGDKPTIYYFEGDLHIGNPNRINLNNEWEISKGKLAGNTSGARTIVVVGNLAINTRIAYKTDSVKSLKKLPSVAWIVLKSPLDPNSGNITIHDCIHPRGIGGAGEAVPLAGLFFAENTIKTGTGGTKNIPCDKRKADGTLDGANKFYDATLRVYGKLIAKKIELQREWRGFSKASEAIWDDGRLIVNPPPGIEEFVKKLPLW